MKLAPLIGLIVWITMVLVLLKIIEVTKLQPFDPQQKLHTQSMTNNFETNFASVLKASTGEIANTAVHFRTGNCICESLAQNHSDELANNLSISGYKNLTLTLDELTEITAYIPSTPAVAIFNESQQLIYLGPYSIGLGCFTDNSLVASISRYLSATYLGAQINSAVEGCYCTT